LGDYVEKEQNVGVMGNTGNVHGPTGCHLHFEVHGAQNPFAK
ncbi:MAG: peptidoglycan DD-metalloendopeptidase family protein, partial [Candidatus Liptonbacteria bacterium]|nr:peptidoglycan DD-metalloendopeptidase family protein [Candidatus Liptonbacteria bacterium]